MLDDYVVKEVSNKVQLAKILWWGDKKTNNKANKWGGFGFCFGRVE
jgi:hypothetical protein